MKVITNFKHDFYTNGQKSLQIKNATCINWHPAKNVMVIYPWYKKASDRTIKSFLKKSGFDSQSIENILTLTKTAEFWNNDPLCIQF